MTDRLLGAPTALSAGYRRTLAGLRTGNRRELMLGLVLLGYTYLRRTAPQRELIYSRKLKEGEHITVRNAPSGAHPLVIDQVSPDDGSQTL